MRRFFLPLFVVLVAVASFACMYFAFMTNPQMEKDLATAKSLAADSHNPSNSEKADALYKKCVAVARKSKNKADLYVVLAAYGPFLYDYHRFDEAITVFKNAAESAAIIEHPMNENWCLERVAECQHYKYGEDGVVPDLAPIQRAAVLIAKENGQFSDLGRAQITARLACIYSDRGEYKKADENFAKALDLLKLVKSRKGDKDKTISGQVRVMNEQMNSLVARGDYAGGNKMFIAASELASQASEELSNQISQELVNTYRAGMRLNALKEAGIWPGLRQLWQAGKFEELDKAIDEIRASKKVRANGRWFLDDVYDQITLSEYDSNEHWQSHIAKLRSWANKGTGSDNGKIALTGELVAYGFKARGHGWADSVSEEGWKQMHERTQEAWKILNQTKQRPPDWYTTALRTGLAISLEDKEYNQLFAEARKKYPDYDNVIFMKSYWLQPRWHGGQGEAEKFVEGEAAKRSTTDGDILYARVAGHLDRTIGDVIGETGMDWKRIKKGYLSLVKANYPDIYAMRGELSIIATRADDKSTAEHAFDK